MAVNLLLNIAFIVPLGHIVKALATALSSTVNVALLYRTLRRRGQFVPDPQLKRRAARLGAAALAMGVALWFLVDRFAPYTSGPSLARWAAMAVLVSLGGAIYAAASFAFGAFRPSDLRALLRRPAKA